MAMIVDVLVSQSALLAVDLAVATMSVIWIPLTTVMGEMAARQIVWLRQSVFLRVDLVASPIATTLAPQVTAMEERAAKQMVCVSSLGANPEEEPAVRIIHLTPVPQETETVVMVATLMVVSVAALPEDLVGARTKIMKPVTMVTVVMVVALFLVGFLSPTEDVAATKTA
jgi:hypothetical protein